MADKPPIIVRAFELAPQCDSLKDLARLLRSEGYNSVDSHLFGLGLQRQLRERYKGGVGVKKGGVLRNRAASFPEVGRPLHPLSGPPTFAGSERMCYDGDSPHASGVVMTDRSYAEQRALQERVAADQAKHPKARKAHSDLADRYEKLAGHPES